MSSLSINRVRSRQLILILLLSLLGVTQPWWTFTHWSITFLFIEIIYLLRRRLNIQFKDLSLLANVSECSFINLLN